MQRLDKLIDDQKTRRTKGIISGLAGFAATGAGYALNSTGVGAIIGVPLMLIGAYLIHDSNKKIDYYENQKKK